MVEDREEADKIFTPADHLLLLQLTTLRAIAKRVFDKLSSDKDQINISCKPGEALREQTIPDSWRLVPDGVNLYEWQQECLPIWLERGRGTVKVATGGGKTLFALATAQTLQNLSEPNLRLIIVVPTIPLMFQWGEEISRGNLPLSSIGYMGGGQELKSLTYLRVLICVLNSARDRLPELIQRADWSGRSLLVVDECHRASAAQARRIFESKPRYTLGLSATPETELDSAEIDKSYEAGVVGQALGPIIYDFTLQQSLDAGLLTPFEVWHLGLQLSPVEITEHDRLSREIRDLRKTLQIIHSKSKSKQGFIPWCQSKAGRGGYGSLEAERFIGLANRRKRLLYRAKVRSDITLSILSESLSDKNSRSIIFHESIEEIESFFLRALESKIPAVMDHSLLPETLRAENIEAFREGTAQLIISAKTLVEGFNVPSADIGIIMASSSSIRQRIQSLGRMLRIKPGGRTARIIVLYIKNTEDEAIYEKADWEKVIGAKLNRYFLWQFPGEGMDWFAGLEEKDTPPRSYRPSSWEINVSELKPGDSYPGRVDGKDLRVDQDGNLRADDETLIQFPNYLTKEILAHSPQRRATLTPAGHVIVRKVSSASGTSDWSFIGVAHENGITAKNVTRFKLKDISGRRVITHDKIPGEKILRYALGPESAKIPEAGKARDNLLDWVKQQQSGKHKINFLYWDGGTEYWIEVDGIRIPYGDPLPPLEFEE